VNSVPKPLSIQRCCALPHSEGDDLSEEEITTVRDRADAMARLTMICFANGARNPTSGTMTSTPSDACGSISIWFPIGCRLKSARYRNRRFGRSNRPTLAPSATCGGLNMWWPRFSPDGTGWRIGSRRRSAFRRRRRSESHLSAVPQKLMNKDLPVFVDVLQKTFIARLRGREPQLLT
jgi:hypothetical protein